MKHRKQFRTVITTITLATLCFSQPTQAQVINTIAGTGNSGYSGDNAAAVSADLNNPYGVAMDNFGNIYFADNNNHCIRKVDTAGIITTIAGNGMAGFGGDNGPATAAQLLQPTDVSVDAMGNIYIVDGGNGRIRKVDAAGNITTIAGTGIPGFSGDNGPATDAQLSSLSFITLDNYGNIYFSDNDNNRIRKIDVAGIITTIAGDGTVGHTGDNGPAVNARVGGILGIAADLAGNIYFTEQDYQYIRKINTNGIITTIAGTGVAGCTGDGGPALSAELHNPSGVAVDAMGNVYVTELYNESVRKIDATGKITKLAGNGVSGFGGDNGPALAASLYVPEDVVADGKGNVIIADFFNNRLRYVSCVAVTPSVTIASNVGTNIAAGTAVTFTATALNGGTNPFYQWKKNGNNVGTGTNTYTDNALQNSDVISCEVTNDGACNNNAIASSNAMNMTVITATGIHQVAGNNAVLVYPIPTTNILHIDNVLETAAYRMLDVFGNTVLHGTILAENNNVSLDAIAPGNYMLEFNYSNGDTHMIRIQKQ
ncbi:MAG: hypothetical protein WCG87_06430 [Bacteroidota bacterium]